jgi:sphinganine-1-phosphate aldolase
MRENIMSNPLHIVEFSNITQMEAEILKMTLNIFHGPTDTSCGLITSGGTESIIIALLAYREWGKARGITKPNIVTSSTAHSAFDKGCFYLGIEIRKVPINKDFTCNVEGMRRQIDSNTVCLVASAPEYSFGIYDPIPRIAAMAQEFGTNCHSDCCLGSYINPFTEAAGFKVPCQFDFLLPGVTSISCDPHKFCYGPKGCSVVMFRTKELRRGSFFAIGDWHGGMYVTPTMQGSRSGAVITGTWAALMKQGKDGFQEKARSLLTAAKGIREDIKKIPELILVSEDDTTCVCFTSTKVNCAALNDLLLKNHRWSMNTIQKPLSSHLVVTDANAGNWKEFGPALRDCVEYLVAHPEENNRGDAAYYGMTEKIPNTGVIGDMIVMYLEAVLDAL